VTRTNINEAHEDFMRTTKSGNAWHCSVLLFYRPVSSTNGLWCFRYARLFVTATSMTRD